LLEKHMGFLDELSKGAGLGSLTDLVNNNPDLMRAAGSLLSNEEGSVGGKGGLNDLLAQLSSGGLSNQVSSWLSDGANMSISAEQINQVLGSDTVRQFAAKAGIDMGQAGSALAEMLPGLIDQLSPQGKAPANDALDKLLRGFK
jgi:uncharacterized protein YidB (DUF937 family)